MQEMFDWLKSTVAISVRAVVIDCPLSAIMATLNAESGPPKVGEKRFINTTDDEITQTWVVSATVQTYFTVSPTQGMEPFRPDTTV